MSVSNKKINISTTGDVYSINYSMNLDNNKSLVCRYLNSINNLIDKSVIKYVDNIILGNGYTDINKLLDYNNKNGFSVIYNLFNNELTELPKNFFKNCINLSSVYQIPDNYTKLGDNAFGGCYNLNNINLHNHITKLGDYVFDGCKMLQNLNVSNITTFGKRALAGTSISSITLNSNVNKLTPFIFADCTQLKNFEFDGQLDVYEGAFAGCTSLTSISIENFNGINSEETDIITENNDIEDNNLLPNYIFAGCKKLDIDNNVSFIDNINIIGIGSLMNCLALKECTKIIPISINKYGFKDCINLESIDISNCTFIDDYAFKNCQSLTSVDLSSLRSMDKKSVFENCTKLSSVIINDYLEDKIIGPKYFKNCESLLNFEFSDIEEIGDQAFFGCKLLGLNEINNTNDNITENTDVNIDLTNIQKIGDYAFANCLSITSITFNNELESLGEGSFMNCIYLKSVTLPSSISNLTNRLFDNCSSLQEIIFTSAIGDNDTINLSGLSNCNKINSITIPESNKYKVIDNKVILDKETNTIIYVVKDLTVLEITSEYISSEEQPIKIDNNAFNNSNISILNINEEIEAPIINESTFANIANNNFHVLISRKDPNYNNYINILGNNKIYYI